MAAQSPKPRMGTFVRPFFHTSDNRLGSTANVRYLVLYLIVDMSVHRIGFTELSRSQGARDGPYRVKYAIDFNTSGFG